MVRQHRRNFLPTTMVNLVLWIICGLIVLFANPEDFFRFSSLVGGSLFNFNVYSNIIFFLLMLSFSLTLTFALLFGNTRRGFLFSIFIVLFLILRLSKIAYWWLILPFLISTIGLELFLANRNKRTR